MLRFGIATSSLLIKLFFVLNEISGFLLVLHEKTVIFVGSQMRPSKNVNDNTGQFVKNLGGNADK